MRPDLTVVPGNLPDPPYPATTGVNGWRFELDYQRLEQSDTWALAGPDWRPWLLMLWLQAWRQIPAGSMPDDDAVIAAKLGLDARIFTAHRDILMRGFRRHSDGRLYHSVVVDQVQSYLGWREAERVRKAEYRARLPKNVPGCPVGQTWDRRGKDVGVRTQEQEQEQVQEKKVLILTDESPIAAVQHATDAANGTPYEAIRDLWIEVLPTLPRPSKVEFWTQARKSQLRARWKDQLPSLDSWRKCFEHIKRSDFLMGKTDRPFRCSLFWITKPENLLRLYEGHYNR